MNIHSIYIIIIGLILQAVKCKLLIFLKKQKCLSVVPSSVMVDIIN